MENKKKINKDYVILAIATIMPLGFVALGIWKAYELYKKGEKDETTKAK